MALDVLGWTKEPREDVNFVLESKLLFTPATAAALAASSSSSVYSSAWTAKVDTLLIGQWNTVGSWRQIVIVSKG